MDLTGGKYFIKIIFYINIKMSILEMLDVPNLDNLTLYEQLIIGYMPINSINLYLDKLF